jgi:hypothetical protein
LVVFAVLVSFYSDGALGRTHLHHVSAPAADYVSALAVANKFLYAWQIHDQETGVLLLTNAAKKNTSDERVTEFFSSAAPVTYEITRGKGANGRYVFPVALYESRDSKGEPVAHLRYSRITVIRTGKEDWAIDTLP